MSITRRTGEPLAYSEKTEQDAASDDAGLYCSYAVQRIDIDGARPHPTSLTQSAALASVMPPLPSYTPTLPRRVVTDGILSGPQLESIIYAGEAHERFLGGVFTRCPETGAVKEAPDDDNAAFKIRMSYFIGDGTGCGKGRQAAGIVLDNWIKGRRKAVWISKSDKLYEDAVRDWTALGGAASDVMPQSRWKLGKTISAGEGVMFSTFATLRGGARDGKASRLDQLLDWLGEDFDGVIVFDEAHAMQNSMAMKGDRGEKKASRQGKVGVDLQMRMPMSRIVYASATGASAVENLAYAERLGLWRGAGAPFASKERFISEMMKGGVAAMEMVCRDLKAMGLYCARNLSFDGVEYAFLDHDLTGSQIEIYDAYAGAFKVIHSNLEKALEAMGVMEDGASRNKNAVGAARSAFESTKQRFFNHLLTAMKMPTLIKAIRADRQEGAASIVQIVSTGEAVMDRALNQLSAADLANGLFDATPRAAVMEYLQASFPTQLHRMVTDENGNENAEAVFDDEGNPVEAREAVALRDALIERLCALPPVTAALDQLIWTFGAEAVAEITGRSRRVVRKKTLGSETMEI
ncbi:MAG: strawberry notch family protein, partial [Pseudomonadota bacterium]